jgi:hypothetical protein
MSALRRKGSGIRSVVLEHHGALAPRAMGNIDDCDTIRSGDSAGTRTSPHASTVRFDSEGWLASGADGSAKTIIAAAGCSSRRCRLEHVSQAPPQARADR